MSHIRKQMSRLMPEFIQEQQLKVASVDHLREHQSVLQERLHNTRTMKMGAQIAKVFGGSMAAIHVALATEVDPNYTMTAGVAGAMTVAAYLVEAYTEQYEAVLDFNLATTASELRQRPETDSY